MACRSRPCDEARRLLAVGTFCIGTNQVDLSHAARRGIPVFNAPFSNTRSVAELIIAEIVILARQLGDRSREVHEGIWNKVAVGSHEVRGKTLGIIGYGHIGRQVGVLAEGFGLRVQFFDVAARLPMGNNHSCAALEDVLTTSDFVTLHVPETPQTQNMIGEAELACMKQGSYLLNASRGTVVDLDALAAHLRSGHLAGATLDVFRTEPLPAEHPFWAHPKITVTPHTSARTLRDESIAQIAGKIRALNDGAPIASLAGVVDLQKGY